MSEFPVQPARVTAMLQNITPLCPRLGCDGRMEPDSTMGSMPGTGLQALGCPVCKHRGYRSLEGIRVLFGTRHEHVCSYGPSIQSLTVLFSGAALALFRNEGLCPTQSALYAAHWALLGGQLVGTLRFFPESPAVVHCYTYFQREILSVFQELHTAMPNSRYDSATTGWLNLLQDSASSSSESRALLVQLKQDVLLKLLEHRDGIDGIVEQSAEEHDRRIAELNQ